MQLNYALRRDRHAIGEFTAIVQLFQSISTATFSSSVVPLLREFASELDLPAPMPIQTFQVAIGHPAAEVPMASPATGVGFQRFSPEGEVAESLLCDCDSMTYQLREYTVWEDVRPKLVDIFSRLMEQYVVEVPAVHSIRVQYLNEFLANSPDVQSSAELFQADSRWIAPFSHESAEPWHCHIGQYIPVDGNLRHLVNVNCDVALRQSTPDAPAVKYVKVLVFAGCYYNIAGGKPLILVSGEIRDKLYENFDMAHDLEKKVLRQVVSAEYLSEMGALDDN